MPANLPHFEKIIIKVLSQQGHAAAVDVTREMFPGLEGPEFRAKISQVSVSLKRLQTKGLVAGQKLGRKNFFRVMA